MSHRPAGVLAFSHGGCLSQGGGVVITAGTVSFESCAIHDNEASNVRNLLERHFPSTPLECLLSLTDCELLFGALAVGELLSS